MWVNSLDTLLIAFQISIIKLLIKENLLIEVQHAINALHLSAFILINDENPRSLHYSLPHLPFLNYVCNGVYMLLKCMIVINGLCFILEFVLKK